MNSLTLSVPEDCTGERLDKWLSVQLPDMTRNALQGLIDNGSVLVSQKPISKNYRLKNGDMVIVNIPDPVLLEAKAENIPLDVVYEDSFLLVVNKPKGMVVHPASGNYEGTLVNALLYHCGESLSGINGVLRPGIVHRIDKNTSGLLIVAKNDIAHLSLSEQIKAHSFTREYDALACGTFKNESGRIDEPIGRCENDRKKMCVTNKNSKNAATNYKLIKQYPNFAHLRLRLETGRTHQIRVHLAYIGHAVLGDDVYGKAVKGLEGQCLHATKIGFIHPQTNEYMEFESELPKYFQNIMKKNN